MGGRAQRKEGPIPFLLCQTGKPRSTGLILSNAKYDNILTSTHKHIHVHVHVHVPHIVHMYMFTCKLL